MTSTPDTDPERIIADAEQEAKEAENLVHTLEEKVRSGDDSVTFEEVEKARGLLSFVRLRKEAAKRKAAAATEAARLAACEALNADIAAIVSSDGKQFSKQLQTAADALRVLYDAVDTRNTKVREFRKRAEKLGIPEHKHNGPFPATHGGVRIAANGGPGHFAGVIIGRRHVDAIDVNTFVNRMLDLLALEGKFKHMDFVNAGEDLFGDLARIDAGTPDDGATHFYRSPGGGVFRKDEPFTDEEIQRNSLTVITKAEADAE
ncbi:hypothetical protein [Arthrobacter sp. B2a2-09]|uniref:hypothetical protein n=1 Tax=Arthrobacter sp. B2a2-09 TaxID=2952822 RepID=UPI0022CDB9AB|nr:hypothetical protein [Arthrobacter sp. B2a2-09]MCZ9884049.1 hypothetical protein [Arthrobacter sp. B2a2-09]